MSLKLKAKMARAILYYNLKAKKLPYMPAIASIELSGKCNYKCSFCPYHSESDSILQKIKHEKLDMSFEDFKHLVDNYGYLMDDVDLVGNGEPLMHPEFEKFVKYLAEKGIKYRIITNGSLLTKKITEVFNKYPPTKITLSLYALDAERYKELTKTGNLDIVLRNLDYFLENNKNKIPVVLRSMNLPMFGYDEEINKIKDRYGHWENVFFSFSVLSSLGGKVDLEQYTKDVDSHICHNIYCTYPWTCVIITANTGVHICCNDADDKYNLGYLNKQSLKDIWNCDELLKIRENIANGESYKNARCVGCDIFNPEFSCEAPSSLFMFKRSFINKTLMALGLRRNYDWTKYKK
ncbi:radical SAM/SPASM domain-containing protein [Methanococcus voltae]|uniref:radical SAM/SPASM domain-containing protein n=1 Tax=Methanococcus voltae TaxID=2188 RepID=UPI001AE5BCAA|nr:radical SAM/SPASM domain-containing protein [Methanococcus voltae]MBP2172658.1 MoaA/NifB/PqqE/SkfB family radical SAM enzyme [Methanococcus voltae]